jgi:hypothetical protein
VQVQREQCYLRVEWGLYFSVDPEEESNIIGFKYARSASFFIWKNAR